MEDQGANQEKQLEDIHLRCQYPNKRCPNLRTTKNNGQLHRFCEYHRDGARRNHRRWLENRAREAEAKAQGGSQNLPTPASVEVRVAADEDQGQGGQSPQFVRTEAELIEEMLSEYLDDLLSPSDAMFRTLGASGAQFEED